MIKVAVVVPSLQEKGPVIVAENIAKYTKNNDIHYIFISLRNNSEEDKLRFNKAGLNFVEVGMGKLPSCDSIRKFKQYVENVKPTFIHAHSFWPTILVAYFIKKGIKVVTLHNNPYEDLYFEYGKTIGYFMCTVMKMAFEYFDKVVAISEYIKEVHSEFKIDHKCEIIYNGVENKSEYISDNIRNEDIFTLVSATVLIKRKNILTALKAVNRAIQEGINLKYYILGDGEQRKILNQYVIDNGLENVVYFLGKQPREKVFSYLKAADCVLIPSLSEGLPLAVIEAMMMHRTVVVSDIPAMRVIIRNDVEGYLYSALDENELCSNILKMMDNSNRIRLSQNAHKTYIKKFSVEQMSKKYSELYLKS